MFCFSNSDHMMISREFTFSLSSIKLVHVVRTTFERNSSLKYYHVVYNGRTKHIN